MAETQDARWMPPDLNDLLDIQRRDSYWKEHAEGLERQIKSMGDYITRLTTKYDFMSDEDRVLLAARQYAREVEQSVAWWKRLSAQYAQESHAERTKRRTLKGHIEIAEHLLMHGTPEEMIPFAIVNLAKKMIAEAKPRRSHEAPMRDPVRPEAGATEPPRDTAADHAPQTSSSSFGETD